MVVLGIASALSLVIGWPWISEDLLPLGDIAGYMAMVGYVHDVLLRYGRIPLWNAKWFAGATQLTSCLKEVLTFPLAFAFGPVLGTKLMFLVARAGAVVAMYRLFVRVHGAPLIGFVVGCAYAFGAMANSNCGMGGHLDVMMCYVALPLLATATIELLRDGQWRLAIQPALFGAVLFQLHYAQGVIGAVMGVVLLAVRPWREALHDSSHSAVVVPVRRTIGVLALTTAAFGGLMAETLVRLAVDSPNHAFFPADQVHATQAIYVEKSPFMYVNRAHWLGAWLLAHVPPHFLTSGTDSDFYARRYLGVVVLLVIAVGWLPARRSVALRRWYAAWGLLLLVQYWLGIGPDTLLWQLGRSFGYPESWDWYLRVMLTVGAATAFGWAVHGVSNGMTVGRVGGRLVFGIALLFPAYSLFVGAGSVLPMLRNIRAPGHFFDLAPFSVCALFGTALVGLTQTIARESVRAAALTLSAALVALDYAPSVAVFHRGVPLAPVRAVEDILSTVPGERGTLRIGSLTFGASDSMDLLITQASEAGGAWSWLGWQSTPAWPRYMNALTYGLWQTRDASGVDLHRLTNVLAHVARIKFFLEALNWPVRLNVPTSWIRLGSTDDFIVWQLPSVAPFAALYRDYVLAVDAADDPITVASTEALNVLLVSGREARHATAIAARRTWQRPPDPHELAELGDPAPSPVSADVDRSAPESIDVTVDAGPVPGVLSVAEAYHPWWTATVDGSPAEVWRAQTAFLAVPLASGRHRVELRLRPPGTLAVTQWLSAMAWVALPLILIGSSLFDRVPHRLVPVPRVGVETSGSSDR